VVFAFKERDALCAVGLMNLLYFDVGRGQTDEAGCLRVLNKCTNTGGKFLQVAAPVCADLQNSSKLQEKGKTGMTVPSLLHVATLWIRIRVQQKLLLNLPLALMSQTPKVYKVSSQKEYIILLFALLFRDAGEGPSFQGRSTAEDVSCAENFDFPTLARLTYQRQ